MGCCGKCIGDRHLLRHIIPTRSEVTGTCTYCNAENEPLIDPAALRDEFELLISIYSEDAGGVPLLTLLQGDWAMFETRLISTERASQLLSSILADEEIIGKTFVPSEMCRSDSLERWSQFRHELMYSNRFFPKTAINLKRLEALLPYLLIELNELPSVWYRARLQNTTAALPANEMGAPPADRASHGRANPAGIPYLYVASDVVTAISEIRPHTGELASVATFTIANNLKLVDLRSPRHTVSPFVLDDAQTIGLLRGDIAFLERLGDELTRPVLPYAAAIDYIPSQYLCEFVKNSGFGGVVYRSSVGDGVNIALFDPGQAVLGTISRQRVSRVSVLVDPIENA